MNTIMDVKDEQITSIKTDDLEGYTTIFDDLVIAALSINGEENTCEISCARSANTKYFQTVEFSENGKTCTLELETEMKAGIREGVFTPTVSKNQNAVCE